MRKALVVLGAATMALTAGGVVATTALAQESAESPTVPGFSLDGFPDLSGFPGFGDDGFPGIGEDDAEYDEPADEVPPGDPTVGGDGGPDPDPGTPQRPGGPPAQLPQARPSRVPVRPGLPPSAAAQRPRPQFGFGQQSAAQRGLAQPGAAQQQTAQRGGAQRGTAQQGAARPGAAQRGFAQRDAGQRGSAQRLGASDMIRASHEEVSSRDLSGSPSAPWQQQVLVLVNRNRDEAGCDPLTLDRRLIEAANRHAADMARRGYFDHESPRGDRAGDRVRHAGYRWKRYGENIARGQDSPYEVVDGWMHSREHRENILDCRLDQMGVGLAIDHDDTAYWVQNFATPR